MISTLNTLFLEKTYRIFLSSPVKKQGNNIHSDIINPGISEKALIMKKVTIPLYFTLAFFSSHTCAVTPDNRAGVIRKNAQTVAPLQPSVDIKSKPYSLELGKNNMVVIPAGRTLTIPRKVPTSGLGAPDTEKQQEPGHYGASAKYKPESDPASHPRNYHTQDFNTRSVA
ncbi:hypothetical protein VQZ12_002803 [Salmonella enterica]|nr:hypothetical protein [Salmonella enterica]EMD3916469.1 hypothetical protein [Salmonella enterica]